MVLHLRLFSGLHMNYMHILYTHMHIHTVHTYTHTRGTYIHTHTQVHAYLHVCTHIQKKDKKQIATRCSKLSHVL